MGLGSTNFSKFVNFLKSSYLNMKSRRAKVAGDVIAHFVIMYVASYLIIMRSFLAPLPKVIDKHVIRSSLNHHSTQTCTKGNRTVAIGLTLRSLPNAFVSIISRIPHYLLTSADPCQASSRQKIMERLQRR